MRMSQRTLNKCLYKKGADLFIKDVFWKTSFTLFIHAFTNRQVSPGLLTSKQSTAVTNYLAFFLRLFPLFRNSAKNEIQSQMDPVESYSIFSSAMKNQQLDVVDELGRTPLHYAACRGATVCCMLLVQVRNLSNL